MSQGQATLISQIGGGSRWGLIGDPTTALGAGMVSLGRLVRVSRSPNLLRQMVKNEVGQTIKQYGNLMDFTIEIEMARRSAAILAAMITEYSDQTTSVSMNTTYSEITGATLCLVRDDVKLNGTPLTDLTTEWYPSVSSSNVGAFVEQVINGDDQATYTVTFTAQFTPVDQDDQDLTSNYEIGFFGSPVDAINEGTPTAWSLPDEADW